MPLTQVTSRLIEDTLRYVLGASGTNHYTFTGKGLTGAVNDPTLYLNRGHTYIFENRNASGQHPFYIKTSIANGGTNDQYSTGVTNNGGAGGTEIVFTVPHDAPDLLYYQCSSHINMAGQFKISGSVTDGSITEGKLATDAVTTIKIADDAVTTDKILDGAITNDKIASNAAIDASKISGLATDSITEGNSSAEIIDAGTGQFKVALDGTDSTFTVNPTSTVFGRSGSNQAVQIFGSLQFTLGTGVQPYLRLTNLGYLEVTGAFGGGSSIGQVWEFGGYQGTHKSGGNIIPVADSTYDLGTNAVRWQNIYADTLYGDGSNLTNLPAATTSINNQSNAYTLVATDAGKAINLSGDITIPNNVFSAGDRVILVNNSASFKNLFTGSGLTIYNTNDPSYPTGNNTIPARGFCTIFFISGSIAYIEGKVDIVPTFNATNNSTNIVLSSVFGSNWSANISKIYNVPSGVTVGGTNAGGSAILISSGMGGTLTLNVSGTVIGRGGLGGDGGLGSQQYQTNPQNGQGGENGGHGIQVDSANATINNLSGGQISGGGGGGGGGGAGRTGQQLAYYHGGRGGDGGQGQGYNQNQTNGASGQNGSYNIGGVGGTGGNGGTLGNNGTSGNDGGNATYNTNFGPGQGGGFGSAGKAIWSNNGNSWTNGTTAGTYHGSYT